MASQLHFIELSYQYQLYFDFPFTSSRAGSTINLLKQVPPFCCPSFTVSHCYPETGFASWWVSSQKTQPSQRPGEGRIYYLQQVRRTLGTLPKAVSPRNSKIGEVLSYGYMHIREGAWAVGRVQALVD